MPLSSAERRKEINVTSGEDSLYGMPTNKFPIEKEMNGAPTRTIAFSNYHSGGYQNIGGTTSLR